MIEAPFYGASFFLEEFTHRARNEAGPTRHRQNILSQVAVDGSDMAMRTNKPMTEADYKSVLQNILRAHAPSAMENLRHIKQQLPIKTRMLMIGIHPGQGEEGFFDIVVHLDGPDLYVLNKAVAPYRTLFDVKCVDGRMQPDVPMYDTDEAPFSVNDAIVDISMEWVEELWRDFGGLGLPAQVFGEEGYGAVAAKTLTT